jgi:hypothetical protein
MVGCRIASTSATSEHSSVTASTNPQLLKPWRHQRLANQRAQRRRAGERPSSTNPKRKTGRRHPRSRRKTTRRSSHLHPHHSKREGEGGARGRPKPLQKMPRRPGRRHGGGCARQNQPLRRQRRRHPSPPRRSEDGSHGSLLWFLCRMNLNCSRPKLR